MSGDFEKFARFIYNYSNLYPNGCKFHGGTFFHRGRTFKPSGPSLVMVGSDSERYLEMPWGFGVRAVELPA